LLNSFQSAVYIRCHSTQTTFLSVHDHRIKAMSLQQVTYLTLLDLSAAFDTIDHSILLERLSAWFGFTSTALSWISTCLSFPSMSTLKTPGLLFLNFSMVFLKDLLSDLFSSSYATPLSTVISNSSANHHLHADDTHLFVTFSADDFAYTISHLEHTIPNVYNWMLNNSTSIWAKTQEEDQLAYI
jgi:Reverse transcriptase (RNA-dependent DNA polymerase)